MIKKKALWALSGVIFVDVMGLCIVFPLFAPLFFSLGGLLPSSISSHNRHLLYGMMLSLWPIFCFFASPILGDLSDKWGRKRVLLLCLGGEAFSYLLGAISIACHSLTLFCFSRMIAGTFSGSQPIAQAAMADLANAETKIQYMSYIVLASTLGVVLGPLIGGWTSDPHHFAWFNYQTPFLLAALISMVNIILLLTGYFEQSPLIKDTPIQLLKGLVLFVQAFIDKRFMGLALPFFFMQLAWALYFQSLAYYLVVAFHASTTLIGYMYALIGLASVIALTYVMKLLLKFFDSQFIFILGFYCLGIGFILDIGYISMLNIQYLGAIATAVGISLSYTAGIALFSNYVSPDQQGWGMGVVAALCAAAWAISAVLAGIFSLIQLLALPFLIATFFIGLAFVLHLCLREKKIIQEQR